MWKKKIAKDLKIAVIGGSKSTLYSLKTLKSNNFTNLDIFYYVPKKTKNLVEYSNLRNEFNDRNFNFFKFTKINNKEQFLIKKKYDLLICIGLSQILSSKVIKSVKHGCIGLHPTNLPEGRGRSSVAWNILLKRKYRISLFKISNGIDDGSVLVKSKFGPNNLNVFEYYQRAYRDLQKLLIPSIKKLIFNNKIVIKKNLKKNEFYCLRKYEDGFINFLLKKEKIVSHIKASSYPHPGAFVCFDKKEYIATFIKNEKNDIKFFAEPGTILKKKDHCKYLVMTANKPIWLKIEGDFKIGQRFLVLNLFTLYSLLKIQKKNI
jgi:methionyl-tRNA formyltransferase